MDMPDQTRRTFLKMLGAGAISAAFPGAVSAAPPPKQKPQIGLQLYTVRKAIETDFDGTIRKVADMGFRGIETYALPANVTLEHAAEVFRKTGLNVLAMHTELPAGDQQDAVVRMAEIYGCDRVVYAGWPEGEKYATLEATKRTAEEYNQAAAFLASRGLRFGLHNHWWEFEERQGFMPFYYLLKSLDRRIFFEIDTYWAKTAGRNPAEVVARFGRRAPLLHIKDGPAVKGEQSYQQVPAGEGVMDFPAVAKAGAGTVEWMIVEFDEYAGDIFDGIRKSYTYLTAHGLARGRAS